MANSGESLALKTVGGYSYYDYYVWTDEFPWLLSERNLLEMFVIKVCL